MKYPCLTVRQPWAFALFETKDIENRNWPLPPKLIGLRIAIHAAKGMTEYEYDVASAFCADRGLVVPRASSLARGQVLGWVTFTACVQASDSPWFEGRFGFVRADPEYLPWGPTPATGALGFWEWDSELYHEAHKTKASGL